MNLAEENPNQIRIDTHAPTGQQNFETPEYRYWGKTPNNYVWFNDELWRIIGLFDIDDGSAGITTIGNVEKRIKIIRNASIGKYSWDSSAASVNSGIGVNEWSQADLMNLLNSGAYYNRTSGTCYNGPSNAITACDFTNIGLTEEAKSLIGNAKWYLGATPSIEGYITNIQLYTMERGTTLGNNCGAGSSSNCTDNVGRTKAWVGEVGLMYPSDFIYSFNLSTCSSLSITNYGSNSACYTTSWMPREDQKTITPSYLYSNSSGHIIEINQTSINTNTSSSSINARPVVYLDSDVKIVDGLGTSTEPYILSK